MKLGEIRKLINGAKCADLNIVRCCGELLYRLCCISGRYEMFTTLGDVKLFLEAHTQENHPGIDDLEVDCGTLETQITWADKELEARKKDDEDDGIPVGDLFGPDPAACPGALPAGWRISPVQVPSQAPAQTPAPAAPASCPTISGLPQFPYLSSPVPDEELEQFPWKLDSGDHKETMYVSDEEVVLRSSEGDRRFSRFDVQAIEFRNRLAITVYGYEYFFSAGRDYKAKEVREAFPDLYWMSCGDKALINLAHVNPDPEKTYASDSEEDLIIGFFGEGNPSISLQTYQPSDIDEKKLRNALKAWSRTHFVGQSLIGIDPKARVVTWVTPEKRRNRISFDEVLYATESAIRYRLGTQMGSIPMQGGLTLSVLAKFFPKFYKYREVGGDPVSYLINLRELDVQNTEAADEEDWKMAFKNCACYHWVFSSNPKRAVEKICKAAALS